MIIIEKYFPSLTVNQKQMFIRLQPLYIKWNEMINVISRKDIDNLYERHVLHSLAIAKIIQFKPGTRVLDVGTGGGFPGIPLAIMFPDTKFVLIDSVGKKIKVVRAVVNELGLTNVKIECGRAEQLHESFDFIVGRAIIALPVFYEWVKDKIRKVNVNEIPNGILYLKGGDVNEELRQLNRKYRIYELNNFFEEEFFSEKKMIHIQC